MPDPQALDKDLKVRIPVRHHLRLHSMKVLTGKQISDSITEALEAYFAAHGDGTRDGLEAPHHEEDDGSPGGVS